MEEYMKLKCMECGGVFYIGERGLPEGIEEKEAILIYCPFCEQEEYVTIA